MVIGGVFFSCLDRDLNLGPLGDILMCWPLLRRLCVIQIIQQKEFSSTNYLIHKQNYYTLAVKTRRIQPLGILD